VKGIPIGDPSDASDLSHASLRGAQITRPSGLGPMSPVRQPVRAMAAAGLRADAD
jgi:hypothetical protein